MKGTVAVWILVGVVLALSSELAAEYLWILSLVPFLAWSVFGLILAFVTLFRLAAPDHRAAATRQGLSMLVMAALFLPLSGVGGWLTIRLRFHFERPEYDRIVAAARALPAPGYHGSGEGPSYIVDEGLPVRVAFPWPGGIIDNWCGAVYDPSAEVLKANQLYAGSTEWRASSVTQLFGGDLTSCKPIDGSYYLCCFTWRRAAEES